MRRYTEMGVSGLSRWGNYVQEEFIPKLQYPQAAKVYQEMADNDPVIGSVLYMAEQLIRRVDWRVEPASTAEADKEAARFLQECMDDMRTSWADFITEVLSMLTYGFSFHEIVYKVRRGPQERNPKFKSKYTDERIGWRKMPGRSQSTLYGWEWDENNELAAFIQWAPPEWKQVAIPMSKGVLFRTKSTRDNPEGRSLLRNAYRPWYFKKRIEEIEGIGIERDLAGLPTLSVPEDVKLWDDENEVSRKQRQAAESLVRNIRRDKSEGVVLPFGWDLKLLSTGGTRQFDTNAIINRYDQRIATTMLADIIMLGAESSGSFSLGEVKKSLLATALESQLLNIVDTLNNDVVPALFDLNYFPNIVELPKIVAGEVETPALKDLSFILRASGLDITKDLDLMNMVRRLISLEPMTQEEMDAMYPVVSIEPQQGEQLDADKDPVGHSMEDNNTFYEGK